MPSSPDSRGGVTISARFWSRAALGFALLAVCDLVMLTHAWTIFAAARPEYFAHEWPTFSRVLTLQTVLHRSLAAIGGMGLFAAGCALAVMQWHRARAHPESRAPLLGMMLCGVLAAPLAVVHYFHMAVTLSANLDLHMALAYVFFFGMSFAIILDLFCSIAASRAGLHDAATVSPRRVRAHQRIGFAVLLSAIAFLLTFFLKDARWN